MSFFFAVDPDDAVRARLGEVLAACRAEVDAKWQLASKLHLTLVFLGEPKAERLATLEALVTPVAARHAPFQLALAGAGQFTTARAPSVLWLGVEGALTALRALQAELAQALATDLERPYVPHLTLARSKHPGAFDGLVARLQAQRTPAFEVQRLTLYESTHHEFRARFSVPLGPREAAAPLPGDDSGRDD